MGGIDVDRSLPVDLGYSCNISTPVGSTFGMSSERYTISAVDSDIGV